MTSLRLMASRIITKVSEGHSLSEVLEPALTSLKEKRDRAFVQALCYGVCRYYSRLDWLLNQLLQKPLRAKEKEVHALLLVGVYQLMAMRIPEYAAVTETVNATESLKKSWARGLVNAVLREYLRQRPLLEENMLANAEAYYAHPSWWIEAIKTAWPQHWQSILTANNTHPPLALRINQTQVTREAYLSTLQAQGLSAAIIPETSHGIVLTDPLSIDDLPGFAEGDVSVQDGAAQLAAELLQLEKGQRVLDACAAPGGKLTHILEAQPQLAAVVAVEKESKRMPSIQENLARLKLHATCFCQDVGEVTTWWDGQLFDRILLDAPCSASGVIRRHPDIKLLRLPSDITQFAKQQLYLLEQLWPLLKGGGLLLYATCSIFPEENSHVLQLFLEKHVDAKEEKISATWGLTCSLGRQILPGMYQMDGFYYACVRKII